MLYYDIRQIPDDQLRTEYDVLRRVLSRTLKVGADRFTMIQLQANNDGSATLTFLILPRSSQTEAVEGNQIADQFTSEMQNMVSSLRRSSLLVYASPPPTQVMVSSVFALRCDVDSYKEVHTPTDRCATASAASSSSSSSSSLSLSVLVVVAGVILGLVCTGIVIWVAVRASPSTALAGRDKVTTQTGTATASSPAFYFGDWTDINGTGPRLDANPNGQQMATRPVSVVHTMPSAEAVLVPINGQYHHFLQASPYSGLAGWAVSSPKHHANDRQ